METVFRPESHRGRKRGIPQSSLQRTVSGNGMDPGRKQTEVQRFPPEPTGIHRTAARDPTTKLRFREFVPQKISIAWVILRQTRKVF